MDPAVIDVGETKTIARSIAFSVNGREDITSAFDTLSTVIESKGYSLNTRLTFDETTQVFAVRRFNDKESVTFKHFDAVTPWASGGARSGSRSTTRVEVYGSEESLFKH